MYILETFVCCISMCVHTCMQADYCFAFVLRIRYFRSCCFGIHLPDPHRLCENTYLEVGWVKIAAGL
jgi:hypothetical protein